MLFIINPTMEGCKKRKRKKKKNHLVIVHN